MSMTKRVHEAHAAQVLKQSEILFRDTISALDAQRTLIEETGVITSPALATKMESVYAVLREFADMCAEKARSATLTMDASKAR